MKKIALGIIVFISSFCFSQEWQTDFEAAKKQATDANKTIIVVFSGSDWCAPCIKLDKNIWQSDAFKTEAANNWVLVKADFPRKKGKLSADIITRNKELAGIYNKQGVFPKMVLLNANGKILKTWEGFDNATVNTMIQEINQSTGK